MTLIGNSNCQIAKDGYQILDYIVNAGLEISETLTWIYLARMAIT